jgi:hypothetical protein
VALLASTPVWAQTPPVPEPSPSPTAPPPANPPPSAQTPEEEEIQRAIQSDVAAKAKGGGPAAAPATPLVSPTAAQPSALTRFFQSLNPDISAILDFTPGWYSNDDGTVKSGDDPGKTGFNLQEAEIALQAVVDPYFRADVFLTIPNAQNLEVEEAFLTTTNLPGNLQLKAGIFRANMGRQNAQHLHLQDFTRRPAINPYFLGIDGLRAPGMELNWLVPRLPFYLVLSFEIFSVPAAEPDQVLQTFGGGKPWDFTYTAAARAFFEISESISVYPGLNYAHGKTSQITTMPNPLVPMAAPTSPMPTVFDNFYDNLYGADLYVKWKPPNQAKTYTSVAWQSEYWLRQIPDLKIAGVLTPQLEGGLYTQVVVQAARRWYFGLRGQVLGIPEGDNVKHQYGGAASITWGLSEFSRIRLYGELWWPNPQLQNLYGAAFLQFEASIGAHGAHPF